MEKKNIEMYKEFRLDERNSAHTYLELAKMQKDAKLAEVYERMGNIELKHAIKWEGYLDEAGVSYPDFKPSWRTNLLLWLARKIGPDIILPTLIGNEKSGATAYRRAGMAGSFAKQEDSHAIIIDAIRGTESPGIAGRSLAQLEGRHKTGGGNALRAAVLGANDGLVSNLSLVMGVAGASMNNTTIFIAGIAGLLAGAFSMALGEWLSVQSSRELYTHQLEIEAEEIENAPEEEMEELALIYESRGIEPEKAMEMARQILSDKVHAIDVMAREELGIDPDELGGSAWEAAITSFILFSLGAVIPVLPFIFTGGLTAITISVVISAIALFLVGAAITLFTGKGVLFSGLRMLIFGLLAAAITFGIGKLIGTSIGG